MSTFHLPLALVQHRCTDAWAVGQGAFSRLPGIMRAIQVSTEMCFSERGATQQITREHVRWSGGNWNVIRKW